MILPVIILATNLIIFLKQLAFSDSLDEAASLSFNGIPGHLLTITSAEENQFITTLLEKIMRSVNIILELVIGMLRGNSFGLPAQRQEIV